MLLIPPHLMLMLFRAVVFRGAPLPTEKAKLPAFTQLDEGRTLDLLCQRSHGGDWGRLAVHRPNCDSTAAPSRLQFLLLRHGRPDFLGAPCATLGHGGNPRKACEPGLWAEMATVTDDAGDEDEAVAVLLGLSGRTSCNPSGIVWW